MSVQEFFDPSRSHSRLASLITQTLELELKLSMLEDQSEYFVWAESNHRIQLATLQRQYENFRNRFNTNTANDFRDQRNIQNEILRRVNSSLAAGMIRGIAISALHFKIAEIEGMIELKGVLGQLPDYDELRTNSEVMERIIESL